MVGPSGGEWHTTIQRKLKKRRIWVTDPDNPNRMVQEWVADETTEKGAKQLAKDEWTKMKKSQRPGRRLRPTWRPDETERLWVQLCAHQLRTFGVDLPEPAVEVDVERTMSALFAEPDRLFEVIRRITQEDQSQALRALPARYLSERAHRELAALRAKLLGWYASRVQR